MELKYLNTFRVIVETGSFTNAAKKLNYTQSAITFQISQLEKELSIKLFEKTGRNMTLTQAGKLFVPYVKEVFRSMDKLYSFEHDLISKSSPKSPAASAVYELLRYPQCTAGRHTGSRHIL